MRLKKLKGMAQVYLPVSHSQRNNENNFLLVQIPTPTPILDEVN